MKKSAILVTSAMMLIGSMSFAGGDIEPVPVPVVPVASTSAWFVGAMVGYENVTADARLFNAVNGAETLADRDQNNLFIGLKLGYMFNFNHRVDIAAEKTNHSDGLVSIPISLNYTYVADTSMQNLHPFVGAGIGLIKWRETILCDDASKEMDLDGTMWQVRAGLLYELNQKTEVEVYYRYSQATFDTEHCNENGNEISLELDNVKRNGIFAGINYKF